MPTTTRKPRRAHSATAAARVEDAAAQCMWVYYRDHKAQLVSHIRECRDAILADLIAGGVPVETAFAPYLLPVRSAKPLLRAA